MVSKKPHPLFNHPPRVRCPVCGETSYSAAGIHPQCAVRQADDERMRHVRLRRINDQTMMAVPLNDMSPWKRVCPVCNVAQHVRMKACTCGHVFAVLSGPPTLEEKTR